MSFWLLNRLFESEDERTVREARKERLRRKKLHERRIKTLQRAKELDNAREALNQKGDSASAPYEDGTGNTASKKSINGKPQVSLGAEFGGQDYTPYRSARAPNAKIFDPANPCTMPGPEPKAATPDAVAPTGLRRPF